jgi:nitroimidazol reductase NimA-like FMN-containing flavoprotein (pyridoxamine 5'-phosphate oxidase superfamily)
MPEYGVDTPDWEALPWSWAAERLAGYRNFWVVTVTPAGRPHALPVWGVWSDDDQRFAFSCAPGSRKRKNLATNPHVTIAGDDTIECISLQGTAAPTSDAARQDVWIERYLAKYQPLSPELNGEFLRENAFLEVTPDRAFAIIEREDEFATRATRWVW